VAAVHFDSEVAACRADFVLYGLLTGHITLGSQPNKRVDRQFIQGMGTFSPSMGVRNGYRAPCTHCVLLMHV